MGRANQRGVTSEPVTAGSGAQSTDSTGTAVGSDAFAGGVDSAAFGRGARAEADQSAALGAGVTNARQNAVAFGDRDYIVSPGRQLLYPETAATETLANLLVADGEAQGTEQSYDLQIDGQTILQILAEADGAGGLQNLLATAAALEASNFIALPVYPSISDVPAEYEGEGHLAYTQNDGLVVFEQ
jgi:hypothetical protein